MVARRRWVWRPCWRGRVWSERLSWSSRSQSCGFRLDDGSDWQVMVYSSELKIRLPILVALYPGVRLVQELVGGGGVLLTGGLLGLVMVVGWGGVRAEL